MSQLAPPHSYIRWAVIGGERVTWPQSSPLIGQCRGLLLHPRAGRLPRHRGRGRRAVRLLLLVAGLLQSRGELTSELYVYIKSLIVSYHHQIHTNCIPSSGERPRPGRGATSARCSTRRPPPPRRGRWTSPRCTTRRRTAGSRTRTSGSSLSGTGGPSSTPYPWIPSTTSFYHLISASEKCS